MAVNKPKAENRNAATNLDTAAYPVNESNWVKALPYGFIYTPKNDKNGNRRETLWLPISPQNITTVTRYATNIVTTLYGVVEEHSETRFYDITIQGTTGYSPRYVDNPVQIGEEQYVSTQQKPGRLAYGPEMAVNIDAGGFFNQTLEIVNQVANRAVDAYNKFQGNQEITSGVSKYTTGYYAFHNLYRFFLKYKKDAANQLVAQDETRTLHPLTFINYKDGVKYECVPVSFTLTRSAESPMLYNYNIVLRCYNLKPIDASILEFTKESLSAFGVASYGQNIKEQSVFAKIQDIAADAKAVIGGIAGGLSVLGR